MKKVLLSIIRVLAGVVLVLGAVVVLGVIVAKARMPKPMPFNVAVWNDEKLIDLPPYPRELMVDDLLDKNYFAGKSRAEVIALLGEPPKTGYFRKYDLVYWLGAERSWVSIDSEWLVIKLDQTGRVVEARILTD